MEILKEKMGVDVCENTGSFHSKVLKLIEILCKTSEKEFFYNLMGRYKKLESYRNKADYTDIDVSYERFREKYEDAIETAEVVVREFDKMLNDKALKSKVKKELTSHPKFKTIK